MPGARVDRDFDELASTIETPALTFQPQRIRKQLVEAKEKKSDAPEPADRLTEIAHGVAEKLNHKPDATSLLKKLMSNETFVYLARAVDPAVASEITREFPEVGSERQDLQIGRAHV